MGRFRGGAAKIAVVASSLFGSISGIAAASALAVGVVTIPLMKKSGIPARLAAAIEACASNGAQLMPPVMGAVAFVMADFLQVPYREVALAALLPSLLYYTALFIQCDLETARYGIGKVATREIPPHGAGARDRLDLPRAVRRDRRRDVLAELGARAVGGARLGDHHRRSACSSATAARA